VFIAVLAVYSCNSKSRAPGQNSAAMPELFGQSAGIAPAEYNAPDAAPDPSAVFIDAQAEPEFGVWIEDIGDMKIIVYKSDRIMEVFDGGNLAARFRIGLGFTPEGAKQREGDGRTPEGEYYVCIRNDRSKFYLSVGLSYPNIQDAQAGYDRGDIAAEQLEDITDAIESGRRPPWDTPLGGEIMIHGSGASRDWTAGCIALENEDMDYIWEHADIGTDVLILP